MKEYLDKESLIEDFKLSGVDKDLLESIIYRINLHTPADVAPIVHAKWKFNNDGSGTCSNCNFTQRSVWDYDNHQRYCGVCGARMD
jgi:hypothetical protein